MKAFTAAWSEADKSEGAAVIAFRAGSVIDFDTMTETRHLGKEVYKIRRVDPSASEVNASDASDREEVWRAVGSQRFMTAEHFTLKDRDGKLLDSEAHAWIAKKYVE